MNDIFVAVLRRRLIYLAPDAPLDPDAALRSLGLDSMQAVDLVFDLEDELGVVLPDEAMNAATFATARNLWSAVSDAGASAGVRP
ncbi:MAG TPA: acyl carrier protein [Candidatus Limnocylindrales bacterium]|nr:acyl carrier protein [Candidatus Limnocylindrales bacterium]